MIYRAILNKKMPIITALVKFFSYTLLNFFSFLYIIPLLKKQNKNRVAFQSYSIHLAQSYETIIKELIRIDKIELTFIVLVHPHFSWKSGYELKNFAQSNLGFKKNKIKFYWQTRWEKFDIMIYNDVYASFPLLKSKKYLLQHGAACNYRALKKQMFRKSMFDFDSNLICGNIDVNMIEKYTKDLQLKIVGLPFLDKLFTSPIAKENYLPKHFLHPAKKTILFAPHWSVLQSIEYQKKNYLSLIIDTLKKLDINIIIKLHSCSYNKAMSSGKNWNQELQKYTQERNIFIDNNPDDVPALIHSDLLLTDISSRACNFMLLDKPVILFLNDSISKTRLTEERMLYIKKGAHIAKSITDIKCFTEQYLQGESKKTNGKEIAELFFANPGKATQEVVSIIIKDLQLT